MPLKAAAEPAGESFLEPPQRRPTYGLGPPNRISNLAQYPPYRVPVTLRYPLPERSLLGIAAVVDLAGGEQRSSHKRPTHLNLQSRVKSAVAIKRFAQFLNKMNFPYEVVLRHERAHCNGWPAYHPGGRQP